MTIETGMRKLNLTPEQLRDEVDRLERWGLEWRARARAAEGELRRARQTPSHRAVVLAHNQVHDLLGQVADAEQRVRQAERARIGEEAVLLVAVESGIAARKAGEPFDPAQSAAWKLGYDRQRVVDENRCRNRKYLERIADLLGIPTNSSMGQLGDSVVSGVATMKASIRGLVDTVRAITQQKNGHDHDVAPIAPPFPPPP